VATAILQMAVIFRIPAYRFENCQVLTIGSRQALKRVGLIDSQEEVQMSFRTADQAGMLERWRGKQHKIDIDAALDGLKKYISKR
jgi:hypothetical protein